MDQEVYLKNVTQIGTPGPSGKIYIADDAYERLHMDDYRDIRVFLLMGHTECSAGKYTTFIEAAITVDDISFIRNIPVWTNKVWNRVYAEIKRAYDNMIIVGWAMDQKGIVPAVTHELESIHREHFGGANQVLLLMDNEQQEERFYLSRNNHLYPKDGFYIYYSCGRDPEKPSQVQLEISPETKTAIGDSRSRRRTAASYGESSRMEIPPEVKTANGDSRSRRRTAGSYGESSQMETSSETETVSDGNREQLAPVRGQYRAMMAAQKRKRSNRSAGRWNAAAAVVTLALVAGIAVTGIRKDPGRAAQMDKWIETISNSVRGNFSDEESGNSEHVISFTTEENPDSVEEESVLAEDGTDSIEENTADSTETGAEAQQASQNVIPVEEME